MRPGTRLIVVAIGAALLVTVAMNLRAPTAADSSAAARAAPAVNAQPTEQPQGGSTSEQGGSTSEQGGKDDGAQLQGTPAERARAAAQNAVPGARVNEIERTDGTPGSGYEVELIQPDGSVVDVHLDANFNVVKVVR